MEMKSKKEVAPAYCHHYEKYAEMIGAPVVHTVFEYLMDEYMSNIKTGGDGEFKYSIRKIAMTRNMSRDTVRKAMSALGKMLLVITNEGKCTINIQKFKALIYAYTNISNETDKFKFKRGLYNGDYDALKNMGYDESVEPQESTIRINQEKTEHLSFEPIRHKFLRDKQENIKPREDAKSNLGNFLIQRALAFGLREYIISAAKAEVPNIDRDPIFIEALNNFCLCKESNDQKGFWPDVFKHLSGEFIKNMNNKK